MIDRPRKILFVISTLGAGGAERVISTLANEFAKRGNDVTLLTLGAADDDHYVLDDGVRRVGLDLLAPSAGVVQAVRKNVNRLRALRRAIRAADPCVVISFMDATNILSLMATRGLGIPVIVSERIDPRHYPIAGGWQFLRRRLYPRAYAVVTQTESVAQWAGEFVPNDKVHTIANPVVLSKPLQDLDELAIPQAFTSYILAVGRLDYQKGFDILLQAYAQLGAPRIPLVILGEGPERARLEAQVRELDLSNQVALPGRVKHPASYFSRAKLFVLSSRFEGFPNVLLEAMAAGLPVVATDCPSGPSDIIQDGETGILVKAENPSALAQAMHRLLLESDTAQQMGLAARSIQHTYSLKAIADQWEKILPC